MPVEKVKIDVFLEMAASCPVFDVRSPGEYDYAHVPGAHNLPLFTNEERKVVGTAYKQDSREKAIKIGLDYFGVKMRRMVEEVEAIEKMEKTVLVHCWRGGMRSAGVAWLLDLYGFKVYTLAGGYKSYRHWAIEQYEKTYPFKVLGGYTGSGKTAVLDRLKQLGEPVIDMEDIAKHKGSAFGGLDNVASPSQEMFENILATELHKQTQNYPGKPIWIEDESQRIGLINLPNAFWKTLRSSPLVFLDIPFEERLNYLVSEYGKYTKEQLVNAIIRIRKRLGGLDTKMAINYLLEENIKESFRILLKYYDKHYGKALANRENINELLHTVPCSSIDALRNAQMLLETLSTI